MEVVFHPNFLKSAQRLPRAPQEKLGQLIERLCENPFDPFLHTKRLTGPLAGFLSFRITREWRVVFQFLEARKIQLLRVAHRRDIYR